MRRVYGAGPLHLAGLLACFALAYAAARHVWPDPLRLRYLAWSVGAVLLHDLVLVPAYGLLDRGLRAGLRRVRAADAVNHVRVPALLSGLLLLVFAPVVLRRSEPAFGAASGLDQAVFLGRWVALTAALFAVSGVLYAVRRLRRA